MFLNVCLNHRRHRTVLHAHSLNVSGFAAASATAALNLPSLVKLASSGQEGDVTRLRRSFGSGVRVRILVKNADFAVLNKQAEQELTSLGVDPRRIHHVQNAVRPVAETRSGIAKSQARRRLGLPSDALVLLFAGRLVPKKEVRTLLKALQLLGASDQRHVHLAVAGDGPLRPDLEQHAAELDVRARLTFLGHLADIDVAFHAADLLVLPSHSEGMPNVLLESMAAGLPFVCADVPGSGDLARRCRLPLAACSTPAALAEAIREGLLLADDREVSNRLRTTATHVYSPKAVAERYVEIYQELLRRSSA
jgi:glycosyltransferase involved in cell wall biosynthesis